MDSEDEEDEDLLAEAQRLVQSKPQAQPPLVKSSKKLDQAASSRFAAPSPLKSAVPASKPSASYSSFDVDTNGGEQPRGSGGSLEGVGGNRGAGAYSRDVRAENFKLQLRVIVVQLYYSRLTAAIYGGTFLLAAVLLAHTLGFYTPFSRVPRLCHFLETGITLSLFLEVALRWIVLGRDYFRTWYNILDGAIAVTSGLFLFWSAPATVAIPGKATFSEEKQEDLELSQSLVMLRIIVQFARVLLIAEHAQRLRRARDGGGDIPDVEDLDLDFSLLREKELQARRRGDDFDGF